MKKLLLDLIRVALGDENGLLSVCMCVLPRDYHVPTTMRLPRRETVRRSLNSAICAKLRDAGMPNALAPVGWHVARACLTPCACGLACAGRHAGGEDAVTFAVPIANIKYAFRAGFHVIGAGASEGVKGLFAECTPDIDTRGKVQQIIYIYKAMLSVMSVMCPLAYI